MMMNNLVDLLGLADRNPLNYCKFRKGKETSLKFDVGAFFFQRVGVGEREFRRWTCGICKCEQLYKSNRYVGEIT